MRTITSTDGTAIGVLSSGTGPGLVVIPGATRRAYHYAALATALGDAYTVHAIDRRGRGASGPQGAGYSIDREVEDAIAVLDATGSSFVFGHSYGGLVALELARHRQLSALIVYDPGVSLNGGVDFGFLPAFARAVERRRYATAMSQLMIGLDIVPLRRAPRAVYAMLGWLLMRGHEGAVLRETLRTVPAEAREGQRLDSDGSRYAEITTPTLLLGGGRSPLWLQDVLQRLERIIPHATLIMSPRLGHNAPDLDAPDTVAGLVRAFLTPAEARP
jgi:pimeloyl-ACP methyl ester carboxylesterase